MNIHGPMPCAFKLILCKRYGDFPKIMLLFNLCYLTTKSFLCAIVWGEKPNLVDPLLSTFDASRAKATDQKEFLVPD